ncbi:hypothetical protein Pelo_12301 [Pelomyxa schiedti]|nr:hypothetical protein Pelo_12301 [Pelomyxa schiedti]
MVGAIATVMDGKEEEARVARETHLWKLTPSGRTVLVDGLNTLKAQCEHMLNVFDLAVPSALPPRVIEPTQPFPIKD